MKTYGLKLTLNGKEVRTEVRAHENLLEVLRRKFGASEVKNGCGKGDCGACTVLLDG